MQNWQNRSGGGNTSRVGKIQFVHSFQDIISIENLLEAWEEFAVGKRSKADVQEFENDLMDNIIRLHLDLADQTYRHGGYHAFRISDPKPRQIHKASEHPSKATIKSYLGLLGHGDTYRLREDVLNSVGLDPRRSLP